MTIIRSGPSKRTVQRWAEEDLAVARRLATLESRILNPNSGPGTRHEAKVELRALQELIRRAEEGGGRR